MRLRNRTRFNKRQTLIAPKIGDVHGQGSFYSVYRSDYSVQVFRPRIQKLVCCTLVKTYFALSTYTSTTPKLACTTVHHTLHSHEQVKICAGCFAPSKIEPTATLLPAEVLSRLYAILASSILGRTSKLASPLSVEKGMMSLRMATSNATSHKPHAF